MKPIENIFGFECSSCEYNRNCYGGNMGNRFKYCRKSTEKVEELENLQQENKKYKEVIDKIEKIMHDHTCAEEQIDEIEDILKEVK